MVNSITGSVLSSYDKVLGPAVVRGHLDTTPAVMSPSCPRTYVQISRRSIPTNPRTYDTGGDGYGRQRRFCGVVIGRYET